MPAHPRLSPGTQHPQNTPWQLYLVVVLWACYYGLHRLFSDPVPLLLGLAPNDRP